MFEQIYGKHPGDSRNKSISNSSLKLSILNLFTFMFCRRQQHQIQQELSAILKRQQQLERTNERLQEKAIDIRRSLQDLELSEGRYHQLKAHNEAELTLKDIVAVSHTN